MTGFSQPWDEVKNKMYNTIKKCDTCGWSRKYDKESDPYKFNEYGYCPSCGGTLKTESYSPDI